MMKLLLNTILLNKPLTGIGVYTLRLLEQFMQMPEFEDVLAFTGQRVTEAQPLLDQLSQPRSTSTTNTWKAALSSRLRDMPGSYRAKQGYLDFQFWRAKQRLTGYVYHEPNFILQSYAGPKVATIHDLSWVHYPESLPVERLKWLSENIQRTLSSASQIITVSNVVRDELITRFDMEPSRVHTTYLAANQLFRPRGAELTQPVLDQWGLQHGQYTLFVGTIEPRKGVMDLLEAWEQIPAVLRLQYPLVLAGGSGWRNEAIMTRIQQLVDKGEVKYLSYISNAELALLLSGCTSFVFPSVYEGFGLPVLEAMASGVPVLCREGTSMAEFAQDAVVLHENNVESLSHQLAVLLENVELRQQYIKKGLERAAQFSWETCAAQTAAIYKKCL